MDINTIFYFPSSLTFDEYSNKLDQGEISERTIVFADAQKSIYKGGKKYGGTSLQEFHDLIDTLYDDSWISDEITNIKADIIQAVARMDQFNTLVTNIGNTLDQEIEDRDANIQNKVEQLMIDAQWLQDNFPQGVTQWDSGWNQDIEAYLQTVGYWTTDGNNQKVTQWSKLQQRINSVESSVNSLTVDGNLTQTLTSSIQQLINGKIASLQLGTTYATVEKVDDVEKVLGWMYSGLESSASEETTFSEMSSMAKNDFVSAISDIRTQVSKVANGDFVAQTELASKVGDTIAAMLLQSSSDNALAGMSARLDTVEQDTGTLSQNVASLILGVTGSSSTADLATVVANKLAGFTTSADIASAKSEIYSAIGAKDSNDQFISIASLKTQSDNDHSTISGIASRVGALETNEAGFLASANLDTAVSSLFSQNSSTKSSVTTEISNSIGTAKTEIYSAIGAKDGSDNFISIADLKTQADANGSNITAVTTRVGTLETNQSGFVASSDLDSAVAEMFASSGNGQNATAKANVVALVKDNKASLELTAEDVNITADNINIQGYLSGGTASFKGDVEANSFTTGSVSEVGIGVMAGEFNELLANPNKAYFAYDSSQGGITMWYYQDNEWKRLNLTASAVLDSAETFQTFQFIDVPDKSVDIIPSNPTVITVYYNRVTGKYYSAMDTTSPTINGIYFQLQGSNTLPSAYKDPSKSPTQGIYTVGICCIKEHRANGTVVNSGLPSANPASSIGMIPIKFTNGVAETLNAQFRVRYLVSDIYLDSSGNITNAVVAPVVVTASSSIWDTTGSRWSFTSRQNDSYYYNAATSIMEINGKYIQAKDNNSYVFVHTKRVSIQEALNTPQPGNNQSYPLKYGNNWTYNTAVPVKYPGDSGYPY